MAALWLQQGGNNGHVNPETIQPTRDVQTLTGGELDRRIRAGWDDWCELLDNLLSTGGMLPSRELAGRVLGFLEEQYWRAEDARVGASVGTTVRFESAQKPQKFNRKQVRASAKH